MEDEATPSLNIVNGTLHHDQLDTSQPDDHALDDQALDDQALDDHALDDESLYPRRQRLNADSRGTPEPVRPRSNASDYSKNPKNNIGELVSNSILDSVGVSSETELVPSTAEQNTIPVVSDDSTTSADDVKIIVEDNDSVIKESPTLTGTEVPLFDEGPDTLTNFTQEIDAGIGASLVDEEPEPGALLEPLVRSESLNLPLISPGDSASEDDGSETRSNVVPDGPAQEPEEEEEETEAQDYPPEWFTEQKHIFIFSEAGKPIYSRFGKEENIVGLFGVMQALLSCVQDNKDDLQCIRTSDRVFVFRCHPPLVLVAIAHASESEEQLNRQLKYVTNQAIFFLTQSHMARLFKNRHNYDLRRQLTGLPKFFDGIIKFVEEEDSFLLESVRCLPMPQSLRTEITSILLSNRCPELVFAIVIYENQIVSVVRPKQYILTSQDLHLLMNYVKTGSTRGHGEKWAPCCLPDFNNGGYLYIHDSYISETMNVSLVLITNEREQHLTMIECKQKIADQMIAQKTLDKLHAVIATPFVVSDTKIPELYHFIYKSASSRQLVRPVYTAPYNSEDDKKQLHAKYCHVYDKLHHSDQKLSIYYWIDAREAVVGYIMNNSEIYCTFSPFVTRPVALNNIDKLLRWIRREESRFFIQGTGVY